MGRSIQVMAMAALVAFALMADIVSSAQNHETVDVLLPSQSQVRAGKPACCDKCICTRSLPPWCVCNDTSFECPEDCQDCVQSPILIYPPQFVCKDWFEGPCTPCSDE